MSLPRLQLFEFNDAGWVPRALRDGIVESLSLTLDWGRTLAGLVAPFAAFLDAAGAREVLDLCAGAGGPARILARELRRAGHAPPRFLLTDLHPQPHAWEAAAAAEPELGWEPEPVDATRIAPALAAGRARLILNALHHFAPDDAQRIFADAVAARAPIFVAEPFVRGPLGLAPLMLAGAPAMLATPVLSGRDRLQKALWTVSVVGPLVSLWDGLVSTMRVYEEDELRAMVEPLDGDYAWTWGRFRHGLGGRGYYFYGVPRTAR